MYTQKLRPRRMRISPAMRAMVRETNLSAKDFVYPIFVVPGENVKEEIPSMPNCYHLSVDNAVKAAHIDNIERKYKKSENIVETKLEDVLEGTMTCPRCGNKLVLRVAKKGENTGKYFYGCSGFPKCRFLQDL